jgi:hypothetical protein
MATIGSISVAFEANLKGLESGIEEVIDLFDDLGETVDDLSEKLDAASKKTIKVKATSDTKGIKDAAKEVEQLDEKVSRSSPTVRLTADTSIFSASVEKATSLVKAQYDELAEQTEEFRSQSAGAARAVSSAFTGIADVVDGSNATLDGAIKAIGRYQSAATAVATVVSLAAASTSSFAATAGGLDVVMGALGGSTAAQAIVLGQLAGAATGAVSALAAYSTVMGVVKYATSGLSEETQEYILGWSQAAATAVSVSAGVTMAAAAYKLVAGAIFTSTSASTAFGQAFERAASVVGSYAANISGVLSTVGSVLGFAEVASGKFVDALSRIGGEAEGIRNMSERFGTTTEQIQILGYAAESAGVGMGQLAKAQQAFYTNVSKVKIGQLNTESVKEAKFAFDRLNVSSDDLRNKSPEEVFRLVAERLDRVQDASDRAAIAFDLFGKQGGNILPALRGLKDAAADAARLGTVTSKIDFSMFENVDQSFDRMKQATGNLTQAMLVALAPLQAGWNNLMADLKGGLVAAIGPIRTLMAAATVPLQVFMEVTGRLLNILLRAVGVVVKFFTAMTDAASVGPAWSALGDLIKTALSYLEQAVAMAEAVADAFFSEMVPSINSAASSFDKLVFVVQTFATVILSAGIASAIMQSFGIQAGAAFVRFAAGLRAINVAAVFGKIIGFLRLLTVDVTATAVRWVASTTLMGVSSIANFLTPFISSVMAAVTGNSILAVSATATGYAMAAAWIIGTLGLAAIVVAGIAVYQNFSKLYDFFADFGNNIGSLLTFDGLADAASAVADAIKNAFLTVFNFVTGFFGNVVKGIVSRLNGIKTPEKINAATSSVSGIVSSRQSQQRAVYEAGVATAGMTGMSSSDISLPAEDIGALSQSIQTARGEMVGLSLTAAQFGEAGRKSFLAAKADFDKLQQSLADGTLSPEEFEKESKRIRNNLQKNLSLADIITPEQLQQSAENMQKSVQEAFSQARSLMRGKDLGSDLSTDRFFPSSAEIEQKSEEFANKYQQELLKIEESLQNGDFGDGQSAIRAADQLREQAKANLDRNMGKIEADVSFASEIRKALEDAFLSPLQKFEKRLEEIQNNKSLSAQEKSLATVMEQKQMVESTFGKSAGSSLRDKEEMFAQSTATDQYGRTAFMSAEGSRGAGEARASAERTKLDIEKRQAAGLDATASQQLKAGADNIADIFGVTGLSISEIQSKLSPQEFADYQEAIKKNNEAVKESLGVERSGADRLAESREKLDEALSAGIITAEERDKAVKKQRDELLSSLGISKTPSQDFEDAVAKIRENAAELSPDEIAKGLKEAKDRLLESLGVPESPTKAATESLKKLAEAFSKGQISAEELAAGAQAAKDSLLQSLGIPLDPVAQLGRRLNDLSDAFSAGLITQEEFTRGQDEARRSMLPGSEQESPVARFKRDMDAIDRAAQEGLIGGDEASQRKMTLQAQLQEDMKPALDRLAPDRRAVESSDVRSKGGVDTFFRILRGNDNPSLKAQLEIARNTRLLAEAAAEPEAAPVIANIQGR